MKRLQWAVTHLGECCFCECARLICLCSIFIFPLSSYRMHVWKQNSNQMALSMRDFFLVLVITGEKYDPKTYGIERRDHPKLGKIFHNFSGICSSMCYRVGVLDRFIDFLGLFTFLTFTSIYSTEVCLHFMQQHSYIVSTQFLANMTLPSDV